MSLGYITKRNDVQISNFAICPYKIVKSLQIIDGNVCGIKNNSYLCAMKIKEIWFDAEHIYGRDEEGQEYSQSLLWYPKLRTATDEERAARSIGMNATLLRNYINGFKKPSAERESAILAHIHKLGKEMMAACF